MYKKVWALLSLVLFSGSFILAKPALDKYIDPLDIKQTQWVDSVFNSMSFEDRLGQLFMIAAYSNQGNAHRQNLAKLIREQKLGGLIFFQGGPVRQANLTNYYQSVSDVPLFIAMDAEWGLGMRLDSVLQFPKQMTLGAIPENKLIYEMGKEIARQFKEMGMHINFAPVVDVNSNPDNPVIGYRAFGEDKDLVANKSLAYMKGLQDHGIMANAKHFPGHGDTSSDSHYTTPVINNSRQQIMDVDIFPFKRLIDEGLMSVMVAHLHVPSLGSEAKLPTTLSKSVVTDLLKDQLKFDGLVFTDALNMKGVSNLHKPGEVDLLALLAGNDVLLYSENVPRSKQLIMEAIQNGKISKEEIDKRVKKILNAKYWAGLYRPQRINTQKLPERISTFQTKALIEQLYSSAITVTTNKNGLIPLRNLDLLNMASITIGGGGESFKKQLDKYGKFTHFDLGTNSGADLYRSVEENLKDHNLIVVGLTGLNNNPQRNFGINDSSIRFLKNLSKQHTVITVLFGNAYAFRNLEDLPHVVLAYEENEFTEKLVPQILFGGRPANGILPVSVSAVSPAGLGGYSPALNRLGYCSPENVGMDSRILAEIDVVMNKAISKRTTPGGTVLVAKNGQVVFEKAYGHLDYSGTHPVNTETIYDLASITKVMATTQLLMFLKSRHLIDMDKPIEDYLPDLKYTNKGKLLLKDIMSHEAGLQAWIPHYVNTVESGSWKREYYREKSESGYSLPVAENMFALDAMPDSLWKWTLQSELRRPNGNNRYSYTYSDVGMYLLQRMVERLINQPMDEFLEHHFYQPLGIHSLTYQPLRKFEKLRIAPTENDVAFRKRQVHGYVHDPGAALYGGVAGHAGLFGTANDLAVLMQMMLQGGKYGDVDLLEKSVIQEFTKRQSKQSRRAWGWDKPEIDQSKGGGAGKLAPKSSFGHTGFTGTAVWADPDNEIIYVFLSNRVYPNASNNALQREGIRTEIHDIVYKSIKKSS